MHYLLTTRPCQRQLDRIQVVALGPRPLALECVVTLEEFVERSE